MGPVRPAAIRRPILRRRLPRSRVPWHRRVRQSPAAVRRWLLVAVLTWSLVSLVSRAEERATEARSRWGRTTVVWVADRALRPGDALDDAVRAVRWPAALAPPAALRTIPAGARAAAGLDAGAAVTRSVVEPSGAEHRTVAVPTGTARLPVRPGDRVDVWATTDPAAISDDVPPTSRVATDARVVETSDRAVVLEVSPAQVAAVADAAAGSTVSLVGR